MFPNVNRFTDLDSRHGCSDDAEQLTASWTYDMGFPG